MRELKDDNELQRILSSFSCDKDEDIEMFLRNKAVEFEKLSKSRTYLICNQTQLEDPGETNEAITIYGYISLAIKILTIPESTSNRIRKELDGYSAKIHGEQICDFPCYLIGQLSKNSNILKNPLKGSELIDFACDVIAASVEAVGGRYIMIECRDNQKLINFYEDNFFKEIAHIPDRDQPMVQMLRKIQ